MRISDWSSDVCSSDLSMRQNPLLPAREDRRLRPMERVLEAQAGMLQRAYPFTAIAKHGLIHDCIGDTPVVVFARDKSMRSLLDGERIARSKRLPDRKSTRLTSSHYCAAVLASSA